MAKSATRPLYGIERHIYAQPLAVRQAIEYLKQARSLLVSAEAPKAANKVRRAIESAEGAERHAYNRVARATRN